MNKTIEIINSRVEHARTIPGAVIEYNFDELPKDKNIKKDSFYGIPAKFNERTPKGNAMVTYKM